MTIQDTLKERGSVYGEFADVAEVSQGIKQFLHNDKIAAFQREALDMIANKLARISCGDPNYIENWHDIAGYASLVEKELSATEGATNSKVTKQVVDGGELRDWNEKISTSGATKWCK